LTKTTIQAPQIIEVKCPWSIKDATIREGALNKKNFWLGADENGELYLEKTHNYWHQIQGQLHITGLLVVI